MELARKYGVSAKDVIRELNDQGIDTPEAEKTVIEGEDLELIDSYLQELYEVEDDVPLSKSSRKNNSGKRSVGKPVAEPKKKAAQESSESISGEIHLTRPVAVKDFAEAVGKKPNEVITELIKLGELAGINQVISDGNIKKLCAVYNVKAVYGGKENTAAPVAAKPKFDDDPKFLVERPPVVTFMGHVDHGKTSLQDAVRHTRVTAGEAGAITQHIGASTVMFNGKQITFIDTPGHAAFSSMRARGANVTDIVVLVVSAAEGFKPQTVEALDHARAAKVPIIVAINKIDLPDADPNKVLLNMQQNNLTSEDWGGDTGTVKVSAKTGEGLDSLLERILMEAEMLELKANPKRPATGSVIEAQLEQGLGPTASILVQDGTLHVGDVVICGEFSGKVRMLISDKGERLKSAGPSVPVKVVGLSGVPSAGDLLETAANEKEARTIAAERMAVKRDKVLAANRVTSAEDLFSQLNAGGVSTLNIIIKADVRGSGEAIAQSLEKLPSEKIRAEVISNAVGPINESDVDLAAATNAIIVGFHVRVNPGVTDYIKKRKVDYRLYSIIYELLEDITDALAGKLEPEKREKQLGTARILQIFELSKGPKICGCRVESGVVKVGAKARVRRDKELIYNGEVSSLRHFRDDVKEMSAGQECGIKLDNFVDFIEGDEIEIYEIELKKATL